MAEILAEVGGTVVYHQEGYTVVRFDEDPEAGACSGSVEYLPRIQGVEEGDRVDCIYVKGYGYGLWYGRKA